MGSRHCESVFGHVVCQAGSRSHVSSIPHADRSDQRRIAADENAVADDGLVLVHAIIVAGDRTGSDVHARTDFGVAQIREVVGFRSLAQLDLLRLDEIADMRALPDFAAGTEMTVRSEESAVGDGGLVENAARAHQNVVAESRVLNYRKRPDAAIRANLRVAQQLHGRFNHSIRRNFYNSIDDAALRTENRYTGKHEFMALAVAQHGIEAGEFHASVDAEHFHVIRDGRSDNFGLGLGKNRGHVGQIKLAVGVLCFQAVNMSVERLHSKSIKAGVNLT